MADNQPFKVAIIGSGPSGAFCAQALCAQADTGLAVEVDVFERLPVPYGLVRYGVAPDHEKIKSIVATFHSIYAHAKVRFLGNVTLGSDISIAQLREHYDAVVVAAGASLDRRLDIPGEERAGVFPATEFVSWYSGHPDALVDQFTLDAESVVVVGVGNVALDVARMLAKTPAELRRTDVPEHVLQVLAASKVKVIHIVGRRGPAQAKFSNKELIEISELDNADIVVDPAELTLSEAEIARLQTEPMTRRMVASLQSFADIPIQGKARQIRLHFFSQPVAIIGGDSVQGMQIEHTIVDENGSAKPTGRFSIIDAQMVLRSVGYRGAPLPDLPFDEASATVPNQNGRVLQDGVAIAGLYVVGWIKRGPTGVIGTNKKDAAETVAALLQDAPTLQRAPIRDPAAILQLLGDNGVEVVGWDGWQAIDAAEISRGTATGRDRVKIHVVSDMLEASRTPKE